MRAARDDREAGTVLVLFALLLVGLFGLLGAVVDGGRLRVTRQQMDAGAECAALEGLRFKDLEGDDGRRQRAIAAVANLWDDDLDPDNGDAIGLGAGSLPIVSGLDPLGGSLDVAATAAARVWKPGPELQANPGNAAHGDMVAGRHLADRAPSEDDAFARDDFVPTPPGSSATALADAPSFLVRLRRSNRRLALDRQPGESSSGPAFEWLWARGSAWQEPAGGDGSASRNDGLTLRAAAIASTERALLVSSDPNLGTTLATIALRGDAASTWNATPPFASATFDVDANGLLTVAGVEQGVTLALAPRNVGATLVPAAAAPTALPTTTLLLPVYGTIAGQRRVVGFTLGAATASGATVTVTRLPATVLPTGASSASPAALDARLALEADPDLRALHATFSEPVLAPVLRR
ncbi:MAG: pilus assembly protein TadG-related protein [Planctomycetota bacterium]